MTKKLLLAIALLSALCANAAAPQPKIIAHRGYWQTSGSAQNSLASLAKADSIGVFGSEFDVWLTADNHLIINHYPTFQGVDIASSTQLEITSLTLTDGEHVPTLDNYLQQAVLEPNLHLVLELKTLSDFNREDLAAAKVVNALRKYGLLERTNFISFSLNACLAFRKLLPDANISYLRGDIAPKSLINLQLNGIDYEDKVLRAHPEWVTEAHEAGLTVNVWTVDTEEDMRYFIDSGVDYITTDQPVLLQELLK